MWLSYGILVLFFFVMIRRPPRSTRTATLFPYTTLFRSVLDLEIVAGATAKANGVPSVQEFDIACRDQRHAYVRHAIWKKPRPPAFFVENQRRRNNPLGLETAARERPLPRHDRSEEHTSELQSLMRKSYDALCWTKKKNNSNEN